MTTPGRAALRLKKKMRLVELARHTGLSAAMLSKLERGLLFPTLPTLLRIALVFGVGLDHFFAAGAAQKAAGMCVSATARGFRNGSAAAMCNGSSSAWISPRPSGSSTPTG
jgi:DNA-binding XRE family transcriptional regulator